jgi:hypothetical protein
MVGALVCAGLIEALPPKKVDELSVLAVAVAVLELLVCVAGCAERTAKPNAAKAVIATAPIE